MQQKKSTTEAVGLTFRKGGQVATVVSNGQCHAVYTPAGRTFAPSLHAGIAKLEAQGYKLAIDEWI